MVKSEDWLPCAQGIAPASPEQAAQDAWRISRHWNADRLLLQRACARSNSARLFDTAIGQFDRLLQP